MSEKAAAFQASVHGLRTVGGRKCIQIILEAPIEQQAEIARICEHDAWVAVARIQKPNEKEKPDKKRWNTLSPAQQAGILCADIEFQNYIDAADEQNAVFLVRQKCGVKSRSELDPKEDSGRNWNVLVDNYRIWQQARA